MRRFLAFSAVALLGFGLGIATDRVVLGGGGAEELDESPGSDDRRSVERVPIEKISAEYLRGLGKDVDRGRIEHVVERANSEKLTELIDALGPAVAGDRQDQKIRRALYRRLAKVDPHAALERVLEEPDFDLRRGVVHEAFSRLASMDVETAMEAMALLDHPELRHEAVHAVEGRFRESGNDPSGFAAFLSSLPDAREFTHFFEDWARWDPGAASTFVQDLEPGAMRSDWMRGVASGWGAKDSAGALEWLGGLSSVNDRFGATQGVAMEMLRSDPAGAASLVDGLPSGDQRRHLVEELASHWSRQDPASAVAWAETLDASSKAVAMEGIMRHWARVDPAAAANYAEALPVSERSIESLHQVAREWAQSDRAGALEWVSSLDDLAVQGPAIDGIVGEWSRVDPSAAAEFALSIDDPSVRGRAVDTVANRWSEQDLDAAIEWSKALTGDDHARASRGLVGNLAQNDPAAAAKVYEGILNELPSDVVDTEDYRHLAGEIGSKWSRVDPGAAADWAMQLPEGDAQRRAIEEVSEHWVRADPMQASEWIGKLPGGEARDAAVSRLVHEIAETDQDAALQWAKTAQSVDRQNDLIRHVIEVGNEPKAR